MQRDRGFPWRVRSPDPFPLGFQVHISLPICWDGPKQAGGRKCTVVMLEKKFTETVAMVTEHGAGPGSRAPGRGRCGLRGRSVRDSAVVLHGVLTPHLDLEVP